MVSLQDGGAHEPLGGLMPKEDPGCAIEVDLTKTFARAARLLGPHTVFQTAFFLSSAQ